VSRSTGTATREAVGTAIHPPVLPLNVTTPPLDVVVLPLSLHFGQLTY
jgi:hypothetical protein